MTGRAEVLDQPLVGFGSIEIRRRLHVSPDILLVQPSKALRRPRVSQVDRPEQADNEAQYCRHQGCRPPRRVDVEPEDADRAQD